MKETPASIKERQSTYVPNNREIFDVALLAGMILTSSGAETYRVEDTVERILRLTDQQSVDVVSLLTSLSVSVTYSDHTIYSATRRIKSRSLDLYKIQQTNEISRHLAQGTMSIEDAYVALLLLSKEKRKISFSKLMIFPLSWGFCMMGNGTILECFLSGLAASSMNLVDLVLPKNSNSTFTASFFKTVLTSLILVIFTKLIPGIHMDPMILGSLILLFPGTTLTNGVRDIVKGDYITGAGNLLSAFATAMALAFGMGLALFMASLV